VDGNKAKKESSFDLQAILDRFQVCKDYWDPIYERGQQDGDFVLGEQYPEKILKDRQKDGRPCLRENRMLPFVNQVINQIRQSRPSIIPRPVDDKADVETAEILRGVIRNVETTSGSGSIYDTAARNSVMSSVGWIRVVTQYASYDSFDQVAGLERIHNFRSVYLAPNHQRQDGSDAPYAFAFDDMDKELFKETYPDAICEGFEAPDWASEDTVRVAEYFERQYEQKTLVEFDFDTIAGTKRGTAFEDKVPAGARKLRTRKTQVCTIKYAKVTASEILEEGEFPGEYIPLVPVYGFEALKDGKRTFYSLIHQAKDPQMMLNYWKSTATEVFALQPKTPFIGAVGQFKSYAEQWTNANRINYPFLEYDMVVDPTTGAPAPPPQRQPAPTNSGTMLQEAMGAADAIKACLGMYDASMGQQTPDISGKAIISRQMQGDTATFHFIDNLSVAIEQVGRILIGIIPIIYTGSRIVRILGEDGTESMVPINQPVVKVGNDYQLANGQEPADPDVSKVISFDAGKYDVVVEVGASYGTKRQELANAIIEIGRVKPDIFNVAGDMFIKALDVPYAEDIAKRLRATMPPELLGDDVESARLQQVTQQLNEVQAKLALTEQALLAKQDDAKFKNLLDAKKVENDSKKIEIDAAKAAADIAKIKAEISAMPPNVVAAITGVLQDLQARHDDIAGALHVLLSAKEEEGTGAPSAPETIEGSDVGPDIGSAT
jgi:hypothetical protein